ncbi:MAG TPA: AbiV family abortive infection protein [Mycobacterium sp.]
MELDYVTARRYWRALVDNATRLIADAHLLLDAESFGRARSLTVLAEEEMGKALSVYEVYSAGWSAGVSGSLDLTDTGSRDHLAKYMAAFEFGRELERFWGGGYEGLHPEDDDWEGWIVKRRTESQEAARVANRQKQRGFYVDLEAGEVRTPDELDAGTVADALTRAAQVIEMMLITDHTRMQDGPTERFDSTTVQQWSVMQTAHPEEFAEFLGHVRETAKADGLLDDDD